jgi:hypothetical protein
MKTSRTTRGFGMPGSSARRGLPSHAAPRGLAGQRMLVVEAVSVEGKRCGGVGRDRGVKFA